MGRSYAARRKLVDDVGRCEISVCRTPRGTCHQYIIVKFTRRTVKRIYLYSSRLYRAVYFLRTVINY